SILIGTVGQLWLFEERLDEIAVRAVLHAEDPNAANVPFNLLTPEEKNRLAWRDGFRPNDSTFQQPDGCFDLMFRWFCKTHELPFLGDLISWDSKKWEE